MNLRTREMLRTFTLLLAGLTLWSQVPNATALERFRAWLGALPADQRQPGKVESLYRDYLKSRAYSQMEVDNEINLVKQQSAHDEVDRWNQILTAEKPQFNTKPNAFLIDVVKTRKPGAALDVGMGQGRNSIWLAQQGWDVTGFDPADKAVALAQETARRLGVTLKTEIKTMENFDFGDQRWDLILLSYVGARGLPEKVSRALKPGGIVVVEDFHSDAAKTESIGSEVIFNTGELPALFPQLRVVRYEEPVAEADFGLAKLRLVRYCGERPGAH